MLHGLDVRDAVDGDEVPLGDVVGGVEGEDDLQGAVAGGAVGDVVENGLEKRDSIKSAFESR